MSPGPAMRSPTLVAAAVAAALLTGAGCSLILDFDPASDAGPIDAPVSDARDEDAQDACSAMEPNNDISEAAALSVGTHPELAICPANDRDFYRFPLGENQDVDIVLAFTLMGDAGDLEMRLYNGVGALVATAANYGPEQLTYSAALGNQLPPDNYTIEVFGATAQTQNTYSLTLTISAGPMVDAGI